MAKRRYGKRRGGSRSKKLPLSIVIPMAVPAIQAGKHLMAGQMPEAAYVMTGIDINGQFHAGRLVQTYAPMVGGVLVHKFAGRFVNRYIPKWLPVSI